MNLRKDHYHVLYSFRCPIVRAPLAARFLTSPILTNPKTSIISLMTFNDGCLGSRNDEERSEMRYVMRIADSVNHQTFERTLRFRVTGSNLV